MNFWRYLYFFTAPNAQEFHEETVRKLSKCICTTVFVQKFSSLGYRRTCAILDKEFMDVAMRLTHKIK
jgi:asparagine synthase (glutamine-hydrolysing)